jgi:hypothetical protein
MAGGAKDEVVIPDSVRVAMQLGGIFLPRATKRRQELYAGEDSARFVHYTSAEAALSIIRGKRIWMRNTTCMSDYSEVHHGLSIFQKFFSDESKRQAFTQAVDECAPGAASEAIDLFYRWSTAGPSGMQLNTYIASISEHDDGEDMHGRLSMWRAFGSNAIRVAIVLRIPWYTGGAQALNVMFSPVAYSSEAEVHAEIFSVIEGVRAGRDFLRSLDRLRIVEIVFHMLLAGAACLKHEGFHEEREWRAIYIPTPTPSPLMESSIESVGGVPQTVYKFPIDEKVSEALRGLDLSRIFDRLIIGPSPYPWVMYEAFVATLRQAGVADAQDRVWASNIPIRA